MARLGVVAGSVFAVAAVLAQDSTPQLIKVQGFLSDSTGGSRVPADGTYSMVFTLYDAELGGSPLAAVGPMPVLVTAGVYSVDLPFPASDFTASDRWIEITVGGEVLAPRLQVGSGPFAYVADRLDGVEAIDLEESAEIAATEMNLQGQIDTLAGQGGNTLDEAYDEGGPGAGRIITADAGPVAIQGPAGLEIGGALSVAGQLAVNANPSSILVGDLQAQDGMRSLELRAGDATHVVVTTGGKVVIGSGAPSCQGCLLQVEGPIGVLGQTVLIDTCIINVLSQA